MLKLINKIPVLAKRPRGAHKGDFGKVLVIAGSRGMAGAAYLTAKGALRSGAGLVLAATPASQQSILAVKLTSAMTAPLSETREGTLSPAARDPILRLARDCNVIALGPGLSKHPQTVKLVLSVLPFLRSPIVIDADGINALSHNINILKKVTVPVILTPHPGEMARLTGLKVEKSSSLRVRVATEFAGKHKVIVVLKGYQTVVTDGRRVYINKTGNPGMATGGSGDVLTGVISGLVAQGMEPFEAARLGVYLHGLAGDYAARELGEPSLIATDILDYLPRAFKSIYGKRI